jgi:pimeloyl-ACP methyl ester carboxylesterase
VRLTDRLLAGRLAPDAVFPAGEAGHVVRMVELASGLRVRTIECPPALGGGTGILPALPSVFIHGWGVSSYTFHRNLRPVADAGVPVWAFDLKGHGYSEKPTSAAEYTMDALGRHVIEVLDTLGLERVLLVGHSMGGGIAVRAATLAPERVAGMVLLAPVGFGTVNLARLARWLLPRPLDPVLPYLAWRLTARVALGLAYGAGRPTPRDVDEYWAPTADPTFVRVVREVTRAVDWRPGRPDELAAVTCPVRVMFGTRDRIVRGDSAATYVRHLRDARLEMVEGAGHVLPEEAPDRVNAAIVESARAWR